MLKNFACAVSLVVSGCYGAGLPAPLPVTTDTNCSIGVASDTVLDVDHCARRAAAFVDAQSVCSTIGFRLPSLGDLLEAYASGAAMRQDVVAEWIDDGEVVGHGSADTFVWHAPTIPENPFRCVQTH